MSGAVPSWIEKIFGRITIQKAGSPFPNRGAVNLLGTTVTVADNPGNGSTDVSFPDGSMLDELAAAAQTNPKIHLVGDSNTAGSNGDGSGHVGGYRHALERALRALRSDFDFIGSLVDAPESCAPGLWFHEGHAGKKIEDITAGYAGYLASAGVGTPDIVVDMIGTNNIAVGGDTLGTMQTKRAAMDAAIDAAAPNAKRIVLGVLPQVAGSTTGVNQATWDALRVSYNSWLKNTYVPSKGSRYTFLDVGGSFGQGNYQSDGIHLNLQGQALFGELLAATLDQQYLGRRTKQPASRVFRERMPWHSVQCKGSGNGASVAGNTGLVPGAGSFVFAVDYYPTSLDSVALHTIAQYGLYTSETNFWALYQQGQAVRLYWANGSGTIFSMPDETALTLNQWHRIVLIADATTLTAGLYVNGQCVGVAQGLPAWNITAGTFYLGDGPSFTGAPGYYSRAHGYAAASVPRPGSMAALLAVESDYFLGESILSTGLTGGYDLNNNLLVGFYNQPPLVLAGTAADVNAYPSGTPIRPWELPGTGAYVSEAQLGQYVKLTPSLLQLNSGVALATPGVGTIAATGDIRSAKTVAWKALRSDNVNDMTLVSLDGANNLTIGDQSWMGSVGVYAITTTYLRTVNAGGATYLAADTVHIADHALTDYATVSSSGFAFAAATKIGFYGASPAAKPTVTGSKGANAALTSLLTALAGLGLLTDSST